MGLDCGRHGFLVAEIDGGEGRRFGRHGSLSLGRGNDEVNRSSKRAARKTPAPFALVLFFDEDVEKDIQGAQAISRHPQ
jgi:hypothetical protein